MKITNRNEIHRRRLKWHSLVKKGMKVKDLAVLYNVDPATVSLGVKRINELYSIYRDAVFSDSWLHRATFTPSDEGNTTRVRDKRLKSKRT